MSDPYKVLGISRDATDEEVKKAYRDMSRRYHPDANVNNPNKDKAEEMFKLVQEMPDTAPETPEISAASVILAVLADSEASEVPAVLAATPAALAAVPIPAPPPVRILSTLPLPITLTAVITRRR